LSRAEPPAETAIEVRISLNPQAAAISPTFRSFKLNIDPGYSLSNGPLGRAAKHFRMVELETYIDAL
jgi:hypothetical protein